MRKTNRRNRIRSALAVPAALIPMLGVLPAVAGADPGTPAPPPVTTEQPATTSAPTPTPPPATTQPTTQAPRPSTPTTSAPTTTITLPTSPLPTTTTPRPPGRLTVAAVRIIDAKTQGVGVPGATVYVQGCSGGPAASLSDGGSTTVTGPCVHAKIDRVPTNWRIVGNRATTRTSDTGRVEFLFSLERGGIVPPTSTTPPPNKHVRFALSARDQDGRGVASEYAVAECDTWRPLGGARTDSAGDGGGAFPRDCVSVVPTAWPSSCVLLGPNAYSRVEGNGVNRLAFRFRCGVTVPPGEVETDGILVKTDRITGAPLAGASFVISRCGSDEAVRAVTTGENGIAAFALPSGCYRAIETAAPAGYVRDAAAVAFDVRLTPRFEVRVTNSKIGAGPVVRNPSVRVPIASVPSGRTA
ncbi:prealbumin-like fold domain-containing protein [Tsukamurella pulmonis]|uniref:prealbumin-like fold domain-containing protein n=1 Tax=Tsukamurella pulmonis TaxID=47312 RepID=UPI001112323F|nr:prealbumin-like fold domain-containing protein [Tsukamurella pulmonis]